MRDSGCQPERLDPKPAQIGQAGGQALEVTDAIAIAIGIAANDELIDDGSGPPRKGWFHPSETAAPLLDPSGQNVSPLSFSNHQLQRMQESVGRGVTRPLSWRLGQLKRLQTLLDSHEDEEVLAALKADLGKPPTEAFFEIVALRQELKLTRQNLRRWMRPRRVNVPLSCVLDGPR